MKQESFVAMALSAPPDEFEALMDTYYPKHLEDELDNLEITAMSGDIMNEAAATEVAAQRYQRKSIEAASKAEAARSAAQKKVCCACFQLGTG
jgi:hypothetical protein